MTMTQRRFADQTTESIDTIEEGSRLTRWLSKDYGYPHVKKRFGTVIANLYSASPYLTAAAAFTDGIADASGHGVRMWPAYAALWSARAATSAAAVPEKKEFELADQSVTMGFMTGLGYLGGAVVGLTLSK